MKRYFRETSSQGDAGIYLCSNSNAGMSGRTPWNADQPSKIYTPLGHRQDEAHTTRRKVSGAASCARLEFVLGFNPIGRSLCALLRNSRCRRSKTCCESCSKIYIRGNCLPERLFRLCCHRHSTKADSTSEEQPPTTTPIFAQRKTPSQARDTGHCVPHRHRHCHDQRVPPPCRVTKRKRAWPRASARSTPPRKLAAEKVNEITQQPGSRRI